MLNYEDFEEKHFNVEKFLKERLLMFLDDVALPTGGTAKRELVFHSGAVAMIPLTAEGKIVLVKQFRKPLEQVILEIPAGKIDPGEENQLETTAMRELEEETGYRAGQLTYINSMYLSPGFANEKLALYLATDLQKVENPRPQDEDEILELYELTIAEAKAEVAKGTICDAKTLLLYNTGNCIYCRDSLRRTRNEQRSVSHSDRTSQTQRSRRKRSRTSSAGRAEAGGKAYKRKEKKFRRFIVKKRKTKPINKSRVGEYSKRRERSTWLNKAIIIVAILLAVVAYIVLNL